MKTEPEKNEIDFLYNGDYRGALEFNRREYESIFERYLKSSKKDRVHLPELLELQADSGRQLTEIIARMEVLGI